jgi:hypothetical protein
MDNPFVGVAIVLGLLAVAAGLSLEFGDKQMSVLDRWRGVRHQWARDHHGID